MTSGTEQAFNALKNAKWMLAIPLIMGLFAFLGVCNWNIQDMELEKEIEALNPSNQGFIQEVERSECVQPKPPGTGHICAQSTDWWSQVPDEECQGGGEQCYKPAWLVEYSNLVEGAGQRYLPLVVPGLVPLLFILLVIRKVTKAREALKSGPNE